MTSPFASPPRIWRYLTALHDLMYGPTEFETDLCEYLMKLYEELPGYEKTILSDLQRGWAKLRQAVLENHPFPSSDRLLYHIDEATS